MSEPTTDTASAAPQAPAPAVPPPPAPERGAAVQRTLRALPATTTGVLRLVAARRAIVARGEDGRATEVAEEGQVLGYVQILPGGATAVLRVLQRHSQEIRAEAVEDLAEVVRVRAAAPGGLAPAPQAVVESLRQQLEQARAAEAQARREAEELRAQRDRDAEAATREQLLRAIARVPAAELETLPGVGRKGAEKLRAWAQAQLDAAGDEDEDDGDDDAG